MRCSALAAMYVGIPYAPISPAYSLMSSDFGKLRAIIELLTPGLVFANDGGPFARALDATVPDEIELVVTRNPPGDRKTTMFADLLGAKTTPASPPRTPRSRPTPSRNSCSPPARPEIPRRVINTQRMLCSNQAMIAAGFAFVADEPPVVVDWLPWSHTFGSNHNFNMVLVNGGSLYIDDGNPTPPGVPKTVRNLREIAPTIYFNVPKGYEALLPHFRADEALRQNFFSRLKVLFYAGAGLNQHDLGRTARSSRSRPPASASSSCRRSARPRPRRWRSPAPGTSTGPAISGCRRPASNSSWCPNEGKLEARLRGPAHHARLLAAGRS